MPKKDYPSREQRMKDLTRQLEQGIREVFDSGKYTEYLAAMSRFHHYSARNVLLIQMQLPNATRVASAKKWREEFGRHINKGEKAIYIIAPAPIVRKVERQKIDPDTKAPMLDENGHVIMEEKEFQVPLFRPVPVFDVSQTDGKPLPQLAENLSGDVRQYEVFMEALRRTAPVPMEFTPMAANMDGYFSLDGQRIAIREGMSQVQTVSAAVHEITHSILHGQKDEKSRSTEELEAESVSYVVCQYYGIETGANSFGYLASWSKDRELSELRACLDTISKTANSLIADIDRHFDAIRKEKGIEFPVEENSPQNAANFKEPDTVLDTYPMPDSALTMDNLAQAGYTEGDLLPVSLDTAKQMYGGDFTVYIIRPGEDPELVLDETDLVHHDGLYAVPREEWEASPDFDGAIQDRLREEEQQKREAAFLDHQGDCFALYQLHRGPNLRDIRYIPLEQLRAEGESPRKGNYDLVYTAPLTGQGDTLQQLDQLWKQFNDAHPADYHSPSMSVSDIVALKRDGVVSCHYVDQYAFSELPGFFSGRNPLRSAEDSIEQNDNQLDGIINNTPSVAELEAQVKAGQQISLLDLAHAVREEREGKKKSVMERLKQPSQPGRKKTAPDKGAERER